MSQNSISQQQSKKEKTLNLSRPKLCGTSCFVLCTHLSTYATFEDCHHQQEIMYTTLTCLSNATLRLVGSGSLEGGKNSVFVVLENCLSPKSVCVCACVHIYADPHRCPCIWKTGEQSCHRTCCTKSTDEGLDHHSKKGSLIEVFIWHY